MLFLKGVMTLALSILIAIVLVALVFAAGYRMVDIPSSFAAGCVAAFLFSVHPAVYPNLKSVSLWGPLFLILFWCTWLWTEHWSVFMRSWILAGLYAFGLWVGSIFTLWVVVALIPWVVFNRRPLESVASLATIVAGGWVIFGSTWLAAYLAFPNVARPLLSSWIHWRNVVMVPPTSLPWFLLWASVALDRCRDMLVNKRSDALTFMAILLSVTLFIGSASAQLALAAVAAPLIARRLTRKEFLLHRRVRWVVSGTFGLALLLAYGLQGGGWQVTGLAMALVGAVVWSQQKMTRAPRYMWAEAIGLGAYLAEAFGSFLHLFPRF